MKKLILFLFLFPVTGLLAQIAVCPNCTQPGTNLVVNGDFSGGNTGFTSNLTYAPTGSSTPGKYAIRTNANNYWIGGCSTPDHTAGGATNLLCIDAKTTGISIAWAQTISGLQQNKDYLLTFYTKFAVCSSSPGVPSVKVLINAAQVGDTILIKNGPWRKCTYKWNTGGSTSAVIQIIDTVPGGNGNDFVLDDIAFAKCDTNTFVNAGPDDEVCTGSGIQLNSTGTGSGSCSWSGPSGLSNYNICNPVFTPSSTGDYSFAVNYMLSGCTVTDTVVIHANPLPATPSVYQSGDTLFSSVAASYQWYSASGMIPGATSSYYLPSTAGNYHVVIMDGKGCTASSNTVQFTPCAQLFTINAGTDQVICEGGQVNLNAVSTGSGSCSWSGQAGLSNYHICNPLYNGSSPGSHLFIVSDSLTGCWLSDSVYITVNAAPSTPLISRNGDTLFSSSANSYQWYSGGAPVSGATAQFILPSQAGYYLVAITNPSGCTAISDSVLFIPCSQLVTINAGADAASCAGTSVQLNAVSNGNGSCQWSGPAGLSSYSTCNPVFAAAVQGDYTYIVTDNLNGCYAADTVTIHVNGLPAQPVITQNGDTLFSDAPSGNQWYMNSGIINGETNAYIVASQAGSYTVTVTDANGCQSSSAPYSFTPCSQVITIFAPADTAICQGMQLSLPVTGNGSGNCTWSGPTGLDNYSSCNPVFTASAPGNFQFIVTDTSGACTAHDTVAIHVDSLPAQPVITISGDTLYAPLSASYQWYTSGNAIPGENGSFIAVSPNIYYFVIVSNAAGCLAVSDSVFYSPCIPPYHISTIGDTSVCNGNAVILSASGNGPGNCYWAGPAGLDNYATCNPVFTATSAGDFTFIVSDTIAGCSASDTVVIHVDNLPVQPVITLASDTFYSTPANSYQWFTNGNTIAGEINQYLIPVTGHWYHVMVTNAAGCYAVSDSVYYSPCSQTFIQTNNDTSVCEGSTVLLTVTGSGNCSWSGPPGLDDYGTCNPVFTAAVTGSFTFIVTDTSGSCLPTDTVTINVIGLPSQPVISQSGDSLYSTPAASYQWFASGSPIAGEINSYLVPSAPNAYYYVAVANAYGCISFSDSVYFVPCSLAVNLETVPDSTVCAGVPVTLITNGNGNGNCVWNGPPGLDNYNTCQPVFTGTFPGDYSYLVYDEYNSCLGYDSVTIHVLGLPVQPLIWQQDDSLVTGTGPYAFQWYFNGQPLPGEINPWTIPLQNGYYFVMITAQDGCNAISDSLVPGFTGIMEGNGTGSIGMQYVNGSEYISLLNNGDKQEKVTLGLYDISGREIIRQDHLILPESGLKIFPGDIRPGIYLVRVIFAEHYLYRKIIYSRK
jgi:hypothetical protein